jgi:hypothetical protein
LSPAPIIFFIFKLITGSEGISLSVLTNPTVMMPVVMCKSGVATYACIPGFVFDTYGTRNRREPGAFLYGPN